jgi:hypothetical protein
MKFFLFLITASLALMTAVPALATLGEDESTIEMDRQDLPHARRARFQNVRFQVHQLVSDNSTILEYTDVKGTVFAITWSGSNMPVLSGLLGKYAQDFSDGIKKEAAREPAGHAHSRLSNMHIDAGRVTIENNGHMGSQRGRAYVPTLIPENVQLSEIQ